MSVIRVEKTKDYTIMGNYHLKEKYMSLKAKGLMSVILSLPNDWEYSIAGLVAICKENESAIKSTLTELKDFGYLQVIKKMPNETDTGRIEYEYIIYENKQKQGIKKQGVENLGVEIQQVENQGQYNINNKNTNKLNINNALYIGEIREIIEYLNTVAERNFKHTTAENQKYIKARLKEGFVVDDFKKVIDNKCASWQGTEYEQYLRPKTLFGANFESYLNEKPKPKKENFYEILARL